MVFANKKKVILFTDAGLLNSVSFFKELRRRIGHQLIPDQPSQDSIQYVLNQLFYKPSDAKWLLRIPMENWKELLDILGVETFYQNEGKNDLATNTFGYNDTLATYGRAGFANRCTAYGA